MNSAKRELTLERRSLCGSSEDFVGRFGVIEKCERRWWTLFTEQWHGGGSTNLNRATRQWSCTTYPNRYVFMFSVLIQKVIEKNG